jgi:hypothetical protein
MTEDNSNPFLREVAGGQEERTSLLNIAELRSIERRCTKIDPEYYESLLPGDKIYYINKTGRLSTRQKILHAFRTREKGLLMFSLIYDKSPFSKSEKVYTPYTICAKNIEIIYKETEAETRQMLAMLEKREKNLQTMLDRANGIVSGGGGAGSGSSAPSNPFLRR